MKLIKHRCVKENLSQPVALNGNRFFLQANFSEKLKVDQRAVEAKRYPRFELFTYGAVQGLSSRFCCRTFARHHYDF